LPGSRQQYDRLGKIKPNIGYLNVFVMGGYAGLEASRTENIAALKETMDRVMEEFREVEAVVVDVRSTPAATTNWP